MFFPRHDKSWRLLLKCGLPSCSSLKRKRLPARREVWDCLAHGAPGRPFTWPRGVPPRTHTAQYSDRGDCSGGSLSFAARITHFPFAPDPVDSRCHSHPEPQPCLSPPRDRCVHFGVLCAPWARPENGSARAAASPRCSLLPRVAALHARWPETTASASWGCCQERQTWRLETTEASSLTVLEARGPNGFTGPKPRLTALGENPRPGLSRLPERPFTRL